MLSSDYCGSFDGTIVHYVANRAHRNPTLLFIHGAGSNHTAWRRILKHFGRRSFIAIDLRNHGLSGFGRFSLEHVVRDIAEVLNRERVREFIPVGMSLGAPIAMEVAKRFPTKARKIVLISPSSRSFTSLSALIRDGLRAVRSIVRLFPARRRLRFTRHTQRIPILLSPFYDALGIHVRDFLRAAVTSVQHELDFADVRKPTLIITGMHDWLLRKRELAKALGQHPHLSHAEVPAHHLILTREPERAASMIAAFTGE